MMEQRFYKGKIRDVGESWREFCCCTSLHGLKFIVQDGAHWIQRIAWALVFLGGLGFSTLFCMQMWAKWTDSPLLVSLETTRFPLSNLPFPAVSICNVNKVVKRKLDIALSRDPRFNHVPIEHVQKTLRIMTKLDRASADDEDLKSLSDFYKNINIAPLDLFHVLRRTAPTCRDMVLDCSWRGDTEGCWKYLSLLPTDDGLCCVFNAAYYSDPELEIESNENVPLIVNVTGNGYRHGLTLVLDADVENYFVTNGNNEGFKVLVHASQKFPDVADRGFVISPGHEIFVGVRGTSADTAPEVGRPEVPQEKRLCLLESESNVEHFWKYSQSGCIAECASGLIKKSFECRPFFLRAPKGKLEGEWTPLCDMEFYANISDLYDSVRSDPENYAGKRDGPCNCPPPCTDEWFEPEVSYSTFPGRGFYLSRTFKRVAKKLNISGDDIHKNSFFKENVAMLNVYYKDRVGIRYKTDIRFGIEDFISAMGGLLSLGLGLSFISVVELIYFVFLRCFLPYKQPTNLTFSHHNGDGLEMANESNDIVMTFRPNKPSRVRSGGKSSDNLVIESNNGSKQ